MRPSISTIGTLGSMGIQEKASIQIKNILDDKMKGKAVKLKLNLLKILKATGRV